MINVTLLYVVLAPVGIWDCFYSRNGVSLMCPYHGFRTLTPPNRIGLSAKSDQAAHWSPQKIKK